MSFARFFGARPPKRGEFQQLHCPVRPAPRGAGPSIQPAAGVSPRFVFVVCAIRFATSSVATLRCCSATSLPATHCGALLRAPSFGQDARNCPLALRGNPGVFASGASVDRALGRTGSEGRRISSGMSPVCYQVLLLRLDIEPISAWSMAPVQTCRHCFLSPMRRNCQMPK